MRNHSAFYTALVSTLVFAGGGYLAYSVTSMLDLDIKLDSSLAAVGEAVGGALALTPPSPEMTPSTSSASVSAMAAYVSSTVECSAATSTYEFNTNLALGDKGPDVIELQRVLNANGFEIAPSGPGAKGKETDDFDESTANAVRRLQEANNITPSGNLGSITRFVLSTYEYMRICDKPAVANVSPTTTKVVMKPQSTSDDTVGDLPAVAVKPIAEVVVTKNTNTTKKTFERPLDLGFSGDDVRALQLYLKSHPEGIYPEGYVTGNFGPFTQKAVGKFQELHSLAKPGDPAYGFVGPATREKLNSLVQ